MRICVAENVGVRLGQATVLDDVSIGISAGEWIAIVGPNGAGKTTLLSVMAGLLGSSGTVSIDGHNLARLSPRQRARLLAYVPQQPEVPPGMSVNSYVLLSRTPHLSPLGVEGPRDFAIVEEVLDQLDLIGLGHRNLESLSGGELQRCHLARALAQSTPIVFLDEPTASLDLGHQQQALDLIERLRRERRITVVMTMHDLTLAAQYSDRMALLSDGRVVAEGSPSQVLESNHLSTLYRARVKVLKVEDDIVVVPISNKKKSL
ncbi:MAG: ABC transporter [Acidimicrobiaceae bacterium]|nr:ABC transporter [Acidimicrobiaceae bacterium]|tara:strand:+ start:719 stop:1504 length:786 start_codon:yes stop_codon:yes gene_type:complete